MLAQAPAQGKAANQACAVTPGMPKCHMPVQAMVCFRAFSASSWLFQFDRARLELGPLGLSFAAKP